MPSITVVLSIYKTAEYLSDFLLSLKKQTCMDFKLLYRFDSEPVAGNVKMLDGVPFAQRCGSDCDHIGVIASFDRLIRHTDTAYVMLADQDDVWHTDKIEKSLTAIVSAESENGAETPILVHSDLRVTGADGREIAPSFVRYMALSPRQNDLKRLLVQNNVTGCTTIFNRALKEKVSIPADAICHDWYLALIAAALGKIVYLDESLIDYRQHADNVYGAVPRMKQVKSRAVLRRRLRLTQKQAEIFLEQFRDQLRPEQVRTIQAWSDLLYKTSYVSRLYSVLKCGFRKNDMVRTMGMWWAV